MEAHRTGCMEACFFLGNSWKWFNASAKVGQSGVGELGLTSHINEYRYICFSPDCLCS